MTTYLALAVFLFCFSLVANRVSNMIVTAPMAFIGFGFLLSEMGFVAEESTKEVLHLVAETTLVVLLFLDAAKLNPVALRRRHLWPRRMLTIGLPLGFLIGIAFGWAILRGWPVAVVALVAAIQVPTDAALGQSVVSNETVPERPRRALTVESGLNDGLALPLVLITAALASTSGFSPENEWISFVLWQIILAPITGVIIGGLGGYLLLVAKRRDATSTLYEGISALAIAAMAYLAATEIGGNGFISCFIAGLAFGVVVRGECAFVYDFTESDGLFLSWISFFLLGAVLVSDAVSHLTWQTFAMIIVSLSVVRPLAIWLSLVGTDASPTTRLFFGWFGPRGLATALFALLVYEQLAPEWGEKVLFLAINTVWISAVLHGVTAAPGAVWYAKRMSSAPENDEAIAAPVTTTNSKSGA